MRWSFCLAGVAAATLSLNASSSLANDSVAAMGAGGLELIESADIRMVSEDLSISLKQVRVIYEFRNESAAAISTRVAFPLPKADLATLDDLSFGRLSENPANPVDFHVKAGGKDVQTEIERKATYKGENVTDFLTQQGVPIDYPDGTFRAKLLALPAAAKAALKARGLADFSNDYASANWTVQHIFHWMQVFPAGQILNVEHDYKPVVGYSLGMFSGDTKQLMGLVGRDDTFKQFCIDARGAKGIARRARASENQSAGAAIVDYILTTGAGWKGTIGRFKLTVDKGQPGDLVSLCMGGMRKTGPTTFVTTRRNFEPKRELSLLFVSGRN